MNYTNVFYERKQRKRSIKDQIINEDGVIDLSSIMVGAIILGMIGGVVAATVFAVIPWAQDNGAKQQLDSIVVAENAYMGLSSTNPSSLPDGLAANSYGKSSELETAGVLKANPRYCVTTSETGKSYTGYSQSGTGSIWAVTDTKTKPEIYTGTLPSECNFITEGIKQKEPEQQPVVPYVDPTPTTTKLTYRCDTNMSGTAGFTNYRSGSQKWSDSPSTSSPTLNKTLTAGVTYTATFEGTLNSLTAGSLASCLRSVDHIGSASGITSLQFYSATKLTDVPDNIPSTVTSLGSAFSNATVFNDPSVGNWDVSNVITMQSMFQNATSFNQPLNSWNTSNVTSMYGMFDGASSFNQGVNNWNTSKVTSMQYMFQSASSFNQDLNTWNVNNWNVSNVTTMYRMFNNASSFNGDIKDWNTSNVTTMYRMFDKNSAFRRDLGNWNMNKVTQQAFMFNNSDGFTANVRANHPTFSKMTYRCDTTISGTAGFNNGVSGSQSWNDETSTTGTTTNKTLTAGVTYTAIFEGTLTSINAGSLASCLRSVDHIGSANGITSLQFNGATKLTDVPDNIPSTVTSLSSAFTNATIFNDPSVGNWDVSNVISMNYMFQTATSFNQPLNSWNTSNVTSMYAMFNNASSFNQGVNNWNTSKVTSMGYMFSGATSFNQDLNTWNVNNWNVSNVTTMSMMFNNASSFNGQIGDWNTSNVTSMYRMFDKNSAFRGDLGNWNMNKVTQQAFMFNNSDGFTANVRANHPTFSKMTYRCDTTMSGTAGFTSGVTGGQSWNDEAGLSSHSTNKTLTAGVTYTAIFEGTLNSLTAGSLSSCLRSVDHIGSASGITSLQFYSATKLTDVPDNIPSTVTNLSNAFANATIFNDPSVGNWNVSNVTTMNFMFQNATSFNQPLNNWNTSNVTSMWAMFNGASSFNQGVNNWNTSKVTSMNYMFQNATSFNQDLNTWNVNNWNVSNVTSMSMMFNNASSFNGNIRDWNSVKVTNMQSMFSGATNFNQDISGWNTTALMNGTFFVPSAFPNEYMPLKTSK